MIDDGAHGSPDDDPSGTDPAHDARAAGSASPAGGTASAAACRQLMQGGSKTFFAASLLLPAPVRAPATALYAFCRVADDAIDLRDPGEPVDTALARLHHRLHRIYAGCPADHPADQALGPVVRRFGVPMPLLGALLDGFGWDAAGRQYETIESLYDYAARVAGTVGAMMALIMQTRSRDALARACELGVAMQLTNIARDVGEDARAGRLYLPRTWLRDEGIDPDAWLAAPQFNEALGRVVARLLAAADSLYQQAEHGIAALPRTCRPAIRAARLVYAEIGREVERGGLDSMSRRAVVARGRKLALITQSLGAALVLPAGRRDDLPPLPAVAYLVDEAARAARPAEQSAGGNFYQRTLRIIELFERVAERNRGSQTVSG
ncbi:MAG: phytoene/squalene synthase family protein [Burkholderiales bacterium]|nr:phytoene/squalene synthase family protein [Burkholderiales bacterium]